MLLKSSVLLTKYGMPGKNQSRYMTIWYVPEDIRRSFADVKFSAAGTIGFPKKIFCHKLIASALEKGLRLIITSGLTKELHSWDGCLQIRAMRLSNSFSLHSWGAAFDINAAENMQGKKVTLSPLLAQCFKDVGLIWGGDFSGKSKDGMHFQLSSI